MAIRILNNNYGGRVTMSSRGLGGKFSYIADPIKLLLNDYPGAAAAYSLRKLNNTYIGPAIRVRRSSDNAEQNIGFLLQNLDTSSLASFAGYQNQTLYSEDYTNAYWTKNGGSIVTGSIQAPDGNLTGNKFTEDGANSVHRVYESQTFVSAAVYTYSVYLKYIGRRYIIIEQSNSSGIQVIFDIQNGLVAASVGAVSPISTAITNVGNGWYRCSITFVSPSGTTIIIGGNNSGTVAALTYTGLNGDAFYIWGSQLNIGYKAQTYQKTIAAKNIQYITKWYDQSGNSRDASMATQANQPQILIAPENNIIASSWHERNNYLNTSAYTMGTSISTFWLGKRTGGTVNDCFFGDSNANYDCRNDVAQIQTGGVTVGNFGLAFNSWTLGSLLRLSGGSKAFLNNTQSSTTNTTTLSAAGSQTLSIGKRGLDTAVNLQGWIREIVIYNADQTSNLTAINANINSYYTIY